jgi:hypothetical protein
MGQVMIGQAGNLTAANKLSHWPPDPDPPKPKPWIGTCPQAALAHTRKNHKFSSNQNLTLRQKSNRAHGFQSPTSPGSGSGTVNCLEKAD